MIINIIALLALVKPDYNRNKANIEGDNNISSGINGDKTDERVVNLLNNIKVKKTLE